MVDEKPQDQAPEPVSQLADDVPDPTVAPPKLMWLSKSYRSGKTSRDGADPGDGGKGA